MKLRFFPIIASLAALPFLASFIESLASSSVPLRSAETAERVRSAQKLVDALPGDSLFLLEAPGLAPLLRAGADSDFVRALHANPAVRALLDQADPTLEELIEQGSTIIDTPLLPRLSSLLAGGLAIGMSPGQTKPIWTIVARGTDAAKTEESLSRVLKFTAKQAGFPRAFDNPHDTIEGADVWFIGEEFGVARRGALLVASTSEESLRDALAAVVSIEKKASKTTLESEAPAIRMTIRADRWLQAKEGSQEFEGAKKLEKLRASVAEPAVQFLLGPSLALLTGSAEFRAELFVESENLRLEIDGDGIDAGAFGALLPERANSFDEPPPALRSVQSGADLLVYRDIDALFEHRAELFAVDVLPQFAEAISNLTLFLGGMDLTEEVLPGLSPWMRLVVDPVVFDEGARPAQPLPGACLLVQVEDPERLGSSLVAAFQSAISLVNIERAQQAKSPFLLGIELIDGIEMSKARYLLSSPEDGVDMEYNLAPACALVGSTFVLGTHEHLVARVIRDLAQTGDKPDQPSPRAESWSLSGRILADTLVDNLSALVMSKVLEEGVSRSEAKAELELVLGLIELMKTATLRIECSNPERVRVELELDLLDKSDTSIRGKDGKVVTR